MRLSRLLAVTAILSCTGLTACFTAVPVPLDQITLDRGAPIEAALHPPATLQAADRQIQHVERVTGSYIEWRDERLLVSADRLVALGDQRFPVYGATVQIPQENLASVHTRKLHRGRTALLTGGVVAGVVILPALMGRGWGGIEIWGGGGEPR
jgi:hypothetical protein